MSDNGKKRRGGYSGGDGTFKKKKGHYLQSVSGKSTSDKAIPLGAVGILVTCDAGREYKSFDEMLRLLEESFQRLGKDHVGRVSSSKAATATAAEAGNGSTAEGAEGAQAAETAAAAAASGGGGEVPTEAAAGASDAAAAASKPRSISDMIAAEVAELKEERVHRFKRHNTDVRGTVFVEFPKVEGCPSPEEVALDIAQHVKATRSLPAKFVLRLLPVSLTCFASPEELTALTPKMVELFFPTDGDTEPELPEFAVDFEHRSCGTLKRQETIDIVAKAVPQPPYKVNLKAPQRTILVQAVRNVVAVSVAQSFKQLAKFNLRRLTEEEDEEEPAAAQPAPAAAGDSSAQGPEPAKDSKAAVPVQEEAN